MSIHKAKGLEFDTVIVTGLGRKPRGDDSRLMLWLERLRFLEQPDLLLAPIHATGGAEDTIYNYLKGIDARKGEYEAGRLLYVAATRAKKELHLLGHTTWKDKDGAVRLNLPESTSLLRRMWTVAELLFQQAIPGFAPLPGAEKSAPERVPQTLERLAVGWSLPNPPPTGLIPKSGERTDEEKPVSFYWVGNTLRHVGTVVHEMWQRIGLDGLTAWPAENVRTRRPAFRSDHPEFWNEEGYLLGQLKRHQESLDRYICVPLLCVIGRRPIKSPAHCEGRACSLWISVASTRRRPPLNVRWN